ncbi:MAG: stage IV sporulation protein A [Emergencia sp.]|nr:stage IV sporulation protein A [Emergencia sp.]
MTDGTIYTNIAERTGGEIFAGVVGPVRTGKSTFIKRFMELFVVPGIENTYVRSRVVDQLPQSGDGRTITTTEPKFIPEEAVKIKVGNAAMAIRLVDCVGYLVPGVLGHEEEGKSRMVKTPWDDTPMPFEEAAERGTDKVIGDHSTVGIMVTTDGSFGDLSRDNYVRAEEKTVKQLKALGKPFVILLNSSRPDSEGCKKLAAALKSSYGAPVISADLSVMDRDVPEKIFAELLKQFPISEIFIDLPEYMDALSPQHRIKAGLVESVCAWMDTVDTVSSVEASIGVLRANENVRDISVDSCDMATGKVYITIKLQEGLYYQIIEEILAHPVKSDRELFMLLKEYAKAKASYDDMRLAIDSVSRRNYGIVHPKLSQMDLGKPEVFRQGNKYGVRLVASAPCLHMIRTDISTEISPIVGSEQQSKDLADYLMEKFSASDEENDIWETNLFGKTLRELVCEQMDGKLSAMPDTLQDKVQKSLQKISNEGKDYFICIIL